MQYWRGPEFSPSASKLERIVRCSVLHGPRGARGFCDYTLKYLRSSVVPGIKLRFSAFKAHAPVSWIVWVGTFFSFSFIPFLGNWLWSKGFTYMRDLLNCLSNNLNLNLPSEIQINYLFAKLYLFKKTQVELSTFDSGTQNGGLGTGEIIQCVGLLPCMQHPISLPWAL